MEQFCLDVIEVPAELLGPSDEEILQRGETKDSPKRRKSAKRLSKRERLKIKESHVRQEMFEIAQKIEQNSPKTKNSSKETFDLKKNLYQVRADVKEVKEKSLAHKKLDTLFKKPQETSKENTRKTSGRILKATFKGFGRSR